MNPSLLKSFLSGLVIFTLMQTSSPGTGFPNGAPSNPAGFESGPSSTVITQLDLYPNIETIGVVASGSSSQTAELLVRQSGDTIWHPAHPLMHIDDGRLVGSLFGLAPATSYEVKVLDGPAEISSSITTQPDELQFTPSTVVHVSAHAPAGGNGSVSAPFQTIQEGVNHAGPGTEVLVADGVYHEAVTFPASGTAGNWLQVRAEGNGAILDGSQNRTGSIWTATTVNHVYFTRISAPIAYLARDQARFYAYDNRTGLNQGLGHNGISMNEGWFFEASTLKLFVRSLDNPSGHTWQIPILNHAFDANGRAWLWIEGFEMRFYGTSTSGCGVCTTNASHLVVRKNKIHNLQLGIFFNWNGTEDQGNDTRIEFNEIYDPPVNEWPWAAVKGSSMEGTAIVVRGHIGAIVRGNELHNFFNGIYTGSSGALENSALAFDADIYNNHIHHISDDALEPEGACINHRFRNNIVDTVFVGMSLAPITQGPTWVLHSLFTNYSGRGFKWDGNSDGIVLIYHNTGWSNAAGINAMDMISPIHNAVLRNNIFQSNGLGVNEVATGSTGHDWNDDNWYITRGVPHFKWENVSYNTLAGLCAATGLECNGYENPPGLTNPSGGDFTLLSSSPNIDRGVVIPGINDGFVGSAPDVGALEYVQGPSISGNAGVGGATLSYHDGTDKTITADANGNYSIPFSFDWSGVVVPSKPGYWFDPPSMSYTSVQTNQAGQNYAASNSWYGGVSVTSDRNMLVVGRPHVGDQVMTYNGFPSGSLTMYVPMLFSGAWGSYDSALYVQNVDGYNTADITIKYYDTNGSLTCTHDDSIAKLSSHGYWIPSECVPSGWVGSATITSNHDIVAVGRPHIGSEVTSYNGFASGSASMYVPMLFRNAWGSYDSALYVQDVDADNAADISIQYYDTDGNLTCSRDDSLLPLSSHGYWIPSECVPDGWVGGAVITSNHDIVAVGRPHLGSRITTYDGFASGSMTAYTPMLFKNAWGSYDSALYVQNVDPDYSAGITIKYYDTDGNLTCSHDDNIPPLSSHGYWIPSECVPDGWVGGAVITADHGIVAVGRPHLGTEVATYDGFAGGNLSASVPMLFKNMWGSYNSAFYVQNADEENAADITIKFYDADGNLSCQRSDTIPALATLGYWVPSVECQPVP